MLALLILAVLYYLWKLNRRKAAAPSDTDNSQEKRPLKAIALPARNSYAPSDFFSGMPGNRDNKQTRDGYAESENDSPGVQPTRKGSIWGKAAEVGRNSILPILGYARKPNNLGRSQVIDHDSNEDIDRATPLPPPIMSVQPGPARTSTISRLFSRAKEPKSPRPARFLSKTFAKSSTVDNDYSLAAYSLGPAHPGEAAAHYNRNEAANSQSAKKTREPLIPPLRKRNLTKTIIGTPQTRGPVVPGEMAGTAVPLISVEEARARAAASGSGLPLLERHLSTVESVELEPSLKTAPSPKSPLIFDQVVHRTSQSTQPRSIRDISRPVSGLKLASSPLRNDGEQGAERGETGAQGNTFLRWTPTPPRLATPRVNELRRDLLSGRPVIETMNSHRPDQRRLRTPELPSTVLSRPAIRRRSVTEPCDLVQYRADKGEIKVSPLNLPDFSNAPQYPLLQQDSRTSRQYEHHFEPDLSPTATRRPLTANSDRRGSGFDWQTATTDEQRISLPSSYSTHGTDNRKGSENDYDSDEEQEVIAELQGTSLRYQPPVQSSQHGRRRSTIWSQASGSTETEEDSRALASDNENLLLAPIQPLNFATDRPQRRLPTVPRRLSTTGGGAETHVTQGVEYSTQGNFLTATFEKQSSQRMGSVSPILTGKSSGAQRKPSDAGTDDSSLSPMATRKNVPEETAEAGTIEPKPLTRRKPISPELLKEIENTQNRSTGHVPVSRSLMPVEEDQRPRARFSDEVGFLEEGQFAFSPLPKTIRLVTPPQLLVYPGSSKPSPEILAPQPTMRRGSMMPPDRMISLASPSSVRESSMMPPDQMEDLTPQPSARRGSMMPSDRITAKSPSPFAAVRTAEQAALAKASSPSAEAQGPKAVQTRGDWRQLRKTSVTGYYLGVTQDDSEDPEIHSGEEGENSLR